MSRHPSLVVSLTQLFSLSCFVLGLPPTPDAEISSVELAHVPGSAVRDTDVGIGSKGLDGWFKGLPTKLNRYLATGTVSIPDNFWENALSMKEAIQKYLYRLLEDLPHKVSGDVRKLKDSLHAIITWTGEMEGMLKKTLSERGVSAPTIDEVSKTFGVSFQAILEELREEFPPPGHAPSHEQRLNMTKIVIEKAEHELFFLVVKLGMNEEQVNQTRAHFERLKPYMETLVVTVGDIIEQHPVLLENVLRAVAGILIGEWILRLLLGIFGFGPHGPVKGSSAAWAQRVFWGAAVMEGSWFARLQRAGMKGGFSPGSVEEVIGGALTGIGIGRTFLKCKL